MPEGHGYLGTLPRLHVQLRADRGPDSAQLWRGAGDHSKAPGQHCSVVALSTNYLSLRPRVKARTFAGAGHWTHTLQLSSCRDFSAHTCGTLPPLSIPCCQAPMGRVLTQAAHLDTGPTSCPGHPLQLILRKQKPTGSDSTITACTSKGN